MSKQRKKLKGNSNEKFYDGVAYAFSLYSLFLSLKFSCYFRGTHKICSEKATNLRPEVSIGVRGEWWDLERNNFYFYLKIWRMKLG